MSLPPHRTGRRENTARTDIREKFIHQKLSYMHRNPGKRIWNLAPGPSDYLHSSALFYQTGKHNIFEVINYKELDNLNLTEK